MEEKSTRTDIECPFYRYDNGSRRICCEGIVEESTISLTFTRKKDFELQRRVFCCEHFRKCEIYRLLMEKYDG